MNIPCLIIDNEPSSQNLLKSFIHKTNYLNLLHICNNALEAKEYLKKALDFFYKRIGR